MSRSDVPDWVRLACGRWGRQKRRVWSGQDWHGNVDGYGQSLLGRIRDERDGAGQGTVGQHWPEVFWGDGLDVQRALIGMPELPLSVVHLHYVWNPDWQLTAAKKAAMVEVSTRAYWEELKRGEFWLFARLDCAHNQVAEPLKKILVQPLSVSQKGARNTRHTVALPLLSLEALQRPTLTRKSR